MRLSFQLLAWRLKRPLAELMPGKARQGAIAAHNTPKQTRSSHRWLIPRLDSCEWNVLLNYRELGV